MYLYSNLKDKDYTVKKCIELHNKYHISDVVVDFEASDTLSKRLKTGGINGWLRIQLYYKPSLAEIESTILKSKSKKLGLAIDLEAYSNSDIWKTHGFTYGEQIKELLKKYHVTEIIIYPEDLRGAKYEKYKEFIRGLGDIKITCLFERTYSSWRPEQLLFYYFRNYLTMKRINKNIKCVIGIWPTSLPKVCEFIQLLLLKPFRKFLYTETTHITNFRWLI